MADTERYTVSRINLWGPYLPDLRELGDRWFEFKYAHMNLLFPDRKHAEAVMEEAFRMGIGAGIPLFCRYERHHQFEDAFKGTVVVDPIGCVRNGYSIEVDARDEMAIVRARDGLSMAVECPSVWVRATRKVRRPVKLPGAKGPTDAIAELAEPVTDWLDAGRAVGNWYSASRTVVNLAIPVEANAALTQIECDPCTERLP